MSEGLTYFAYNVVLISIDNVCYVSNFGNLFLTKWTHTICTSCLQPKTISIFRVDMYVSRSFLLKFCCSLSIRLLYLIEIVLFFHDALLRFELRFLVPETNVLAITLQSNFCIRQLSQALRIRIPIHVGNWRR